MSRERHILTSGNYDAQTGEFGVYIEWDGELEAVLGYSLPAGGYFVKATTPQAYRFHRLDKGLPVYMKLIAQNGRLYPYRTYVMMDGRPFSVEFGGGVLIPLLRTDTKSLGCEAAKQTVDTGSRKHFDGKSEWNDRKPAFSVEWQPDETVIR